MSSVMQTAGAEDPPRWRHVAVLTAPPASGSKPYPQLPTEDSRLRSPELAFIQDARGMQRGQALQLSGNPRVTLSGTLSRTRDRAIRGPTGSSESIELHRLSLRSEQRGLIGELLLPDVPVSERDHSYPRPGPAEPCQQGERTYHRGKGHDIASPLRTSAAALLGLTCQDVCMSPRQGSQQLHLRPARAFPRRLCIETIAPVCAMPVHIPVADSNPEVREPSSRFSNLQRGFQFSPGLLAAFPLSLLVFIPRERYRWCAVTLRHQPVILKLGGHAQVRAVHPEV